MATVLNLPTLPTLLINNGTNCSILPVLRRILGLADRLCFWMQRALLSGSGLAAVLFLVRLGGVYCGCWAGCRLSDAPPEHRQHLWKGMVTQAWYSASASRIVLP